MKRRVARPPSARPASPLTRAVPSEPMVDLVLRPLALTCMVICLAWPLAQVISQVASGLHSGLILFGCALAALETNYSHQLLRRRFISGSDLWRFRAVEFGAYFVVVKAASIIVTGWPQALTGQGLLPMDLDALVEWLFELGTLAVFVLAVLIAVAVGDTLADLDRASEPPDLDRLVVPSPLDSLTTRFFAGGALLLVLSGLARLGFAELLNLERPPVVGLVVNVLVYFLLGLVLLGRVRLTVLTTRWQTQGVRLPAELPARWVRYSLAFIGLAALLALALPTGYTAGGLGLIGEVLLLIATVLWLIFAVLLGLLLLPIILLIALLTGGRSPLSLERLVPRLPPAPPRALVSIPWLNVLRPLLVWGLIIAMVVYVLYSYVHERPELLQSLRKLGPLNALRRLWAALRHRVSGLAAAAERYSPLAWLRERLQRPAGPARLGFFRLGGSSPRDQVYYYYLSLVRRASEKGLRRRPAQTPNEYEPVVTTALPEVQPEVAELTQAFVEARYSRQAIGPQTAQRARALWARVRAALRAIDEKAHRPPT